MKQMKIHDRSIAVILICLLGFGLESCREESVPKPHGYQRIELPETAYASYQHPCGLLFEVPVYSKIEHVQNHASLQDDCWFNCAFPVFRAKLHCTYRAIEDENDFLELVEDAHQMVFTHEIKASGILTRSFDFPGKKVSGVLYTLGGPVASPVQFFASDSSRHFLRGSLYFDNAPNPDSIAPALTRLTQDIEHLIETLDWTNRNTP